jgi:murein DD-endopeptidase MepM/ murein hydrolase activator NlpD
LRLTLQSYDRVPIPVNHSEAHVWTLDVFNVSADTSISITWPLQVIMRAVTADDGTVQVGNWFITAASEQAIGLPSTVDLEPSVYTPGDEQTVRLAIEAPPGAGHALGFLPDPTGEGAAANHPATPTGGGESTRSEIGGAMDVIWIAPEEDPYCGAENTSGPPQQGDGSATYPRRARTPAPALYGYFAGWPVLANAQNTQGFGCTDFREFSGYDCPNDRPWFHSGVDLASGRGTPLYAVLHGRVTYVGVSTGARPCTFPGAEEPRTNLGWMIQLQVLGSDGAPGPYTVKYGHTIVGSQRVQVGDEVWPGQILGLMGSTGCSTGPHLHFMVQNERGQFLDPMNFIGPNRRERIQP